MKLLSLPIQTGSASGMTLIELLISLALMSFVMLSFSNFVVKSNVAAASITMRYTADSEVRMLLQDIQSDLAAGAFISNNSHNKRLEYTIYSLAGTATIKIYQINTINGKQYMQLSLDGGSTWQSPYRISSYNAYSLVGSPKFLYSWAVNNCTDFNDSNGNGVYQIGVDTTGSYLACEEGTSSPALSSPSQATKIDFQNFKFTTGRGSPEAIRALPPDFFLNVGTQLVRSTTAAIAPAAKDSALIHPIITNTANSLFGTAFSVRSAAWDPGNQRLVIVGNHSVLSFSTIYLSDCLGVLIRSGLTTSASTIQSYSVAVKADGDSVLVLGSTDGGSTYNLYGFNVSGSAPLSATSTLSLSGLVNSPTGIAYDASTPNDFYVVGANTSSGTLQITERNTATGALVGSAWDLPAAFDGSHPPGGLAIDPVTGNFLVVRNYINGSAPNKTIDIYIINRSTGSSSYFTVNVSDLGSSATGTNGNWGLGFDAITNHIFLSDSSSGMIFEVAPNQLISPRN